ncbi:MAG: hypothetical protein U1B80_05080 [Anaerolineaceae bacterium]|nr:hypothetical protein [Anaerolineaceae bacterium]
MKNDRILHLAKQTCARLDVVELFAVAHDGRRFHEGWNEIILEGRQKSSWKKMF